MTAADIKRILDLQPHPREGGWYTRTYEANETLMPTQFDDGRYAGERRTSTAIYYLLEEHTFSELHVLQSDEVFHHYMGDAVEMLHLYADGSSQTHILGTDLAAGERPQIVVPRNVWQGSRLLHPEADAFALLGCTVSPGFEFEDYESAPRSGLLEMWPHEAARILALTQQ
jgi:predicted cupin superfamily sugar epimerase